MKTIGFVMAAALSAIAAPALAADVTVTLEGVSNQGGQMLVSLQTREQFMKPAGANGTYGEAKAGAQTFTVENVAPGDYAVMVMHDVNNNWTMDRGADRKPTEGWAMSGNGGSQTRVPTFDEVKFTVPASGGAVTLNMVYP